MSKETFRRLMEAAMNGQPDFGIEYVEVPKTVDEILQGVEIATLQNKVKYLNHIVHQFHEKRENLEGQLKTAEEKAEKLREKLNREQMRSKRQENTVEKLTHHLQAQAAAEASRREELEHLRALVGTIQARLNGGLPEGSTENHAGIVLQQLREIISPSTIQ